MSEGVHPGVHPDPDALNAFVEGALPEHERVECLAHLAECGQCREVVFLAQKAAEMEAPVAVTEAPVSFWQRLLRPRAVVSVVAAAIVAVFSFGLYRMIRSSEPQPQVTASTKVPAEPAPAAKAERANARVAAGTEQGESAARGEGAACSRLRSPFACSGQAPPPAPVAAAVQVRKRLGLSGRLSTRRGPSLRARGWS